MKKNNHNVTTNNKVRIVNEVPTMYNGKEVHVYYQRKPGNITVVIDATTAKFRASDYAAGMKQSFLAYQNAMKEHAPDHRIVTFGQLFQDRLNQYETAIANGKSWTVPTHEALLNSILNNGATVIMLGQFYNQKTPVVRNNGQQYTIGELLYRAAKTKENSTHLVKSSQLTDIYETNKSRTCCYINSWDACKPGSLKLISSTLDLIGATDAAQEYRKTKADADLDYQFLTLLEESTSFSDAKEIYELVGKDRERFTSHLLYLLQQEAEDNKLYDLGTQTLTSRYKQCSWEFDTHYSSIGTTRDVEYKVSDTLSYEVSELVSTDTHVSGTNDSLRIADYYDRTELDILQEYLSYSFYNKVLSESTDEKDLEVFSPMRRVYDEELYEDEVEDTRVYRTSYGQVIDGYADNMQASGIVTRLE